jgi:competence protein ComEC
MSSTKNTRRVIIHLLIGAALIAIVFSQISCGAVSGSDEENPPITPGEEGFKVYFLDIGQADSALILSDGRSMLIDGGNVPDSDLVYAFLKGKGIKHLDCVVATHAHEDHVGGLAGALNFAKVDTALCPVTKYDSKAFDNFVKYLGRQGVSITVPKYGDTFKLGS